MIHELGYRDKVIIPDKYNTGVENESALIPVAQKFPGWDGYMTATTITSNGGYVFENIIFTNTIAIKASQISHALYFKNCKFDGATSYAVSDSGDWNNSMELFFDHCEFSGYTSAAVKPFDKTIFRNCKIHHMPSDGLKGGLSNGGFENCYIYDIGYNNPEAHADGVQTTGGNTNLYIKNCRFDVPTTKENVGNAGIFFVQEYDSVDAEIKDILINGGNYSLYIGIKEEKTATITGLTGSNIKIGASYAYGRANITDAQYQNWNSNGTITDQDKLFASSVFTGANGKIKVIVSNYTESARTLILVSDKETQTYTVPAHPTSEQLSNLTFADLPYDLEYEIEGNYVICYDGSISDANEIRFAYATVKKLFSDIADAVRSKTGLQDLIPRQGLPKEISSITGSATLGTKNITANGTYDAEDDNLDGYSSVTVNVSGLPSNMAIEDIEIETASTSIDIPYDKTKTVFMIYVYDLDLSESSAYTVTMVTTKRHTISGTYISTSTIIGGNTDDDGAASATPTFDTENGIVNIYCRESRYFRDGRTYRAIIIYDDSEES